MKIKQLLSMRMMILIIVLILALFAINPKPYASGVEIRYVDDVTAENGLSPGLIVHGINGRDVVTVDDFNEILVEESGKKTYNESAKLEFNTNEGRFAFLVKEAPKIIVKEAAKSNILLGLDLAGGTRVLLQPEVEEGKVTDQDITDLITVLDNRLNVYGLSDLKIRSAKDWEGNKFILVEIAGASREEVRDLVEEQGVFEAKIGDEVVFEGGKKDITFVCRNDGTCSGIKPPCTKSQDGWYCKFEFVIHLSADAARKHAEVTKDIPINISESGSEYLSKTIDFYLDGNEVDRLQISADLKGKEATGIAISGPGNGQTESEAYGSALENMNRLQTILITGSLPLKLNVVKLDTISPIVGQNFAKNSVVVGLFALLVVVIVLSVKYRKVKIVIPVLMTSLCEVFLILGFAAFVKWNFDLASIAGVIAAIGTGVDDQIIITDEVLGGHAQNIYVNIKARVKRAFFTIFAACATTIAAMIPLWNAGAGLIRGFAVTTIVGVLIGVLITRPTYGKVIETLLAEE